MIYFDHAATSLYKPPQVIEAVIQAMQGLGNAGRGAHAASLDASRMIYKTREKIAELFGAESPMQAAFTKNATEALNIAIKGLLQPGAHVISTQIEHNSVLRPLYEMEQSGVEVTLLKADHLGNIHPEDMEKEWKDNTKAVICTHVSNVTGNITDIASMGRICKEHKALFIVDASQSAGVIPIHMQDMGIDVLCFTGHKGLCGPQGTGGICVRKGIAIKPILSGGSGNHSFSKVQPAAMPEVLEAGTLNAHAIAGLHAALMYIEQVGLHTILQREQKLAALFYEEICKLPHIKVYGDFSKEKAPIVSMNIGNADSAEVADRLSTEYGILTRPGAHCAPLLHQALGTAEQGAVRFSFSYRNTEEEVGQAVHALKNF